MKELALNADMGEAILARLQDFTSLPGRGYVAGQAVASAVSELFGDGRAVKYNDVDVFRDLTPAEVQEYIDIPNLPRATRAIRTTRFTTLEIEEEYRRPVANPVDRYRVLRTRREGLLNEIVCRFDDDNPQKFLETFDINCVQVGVDLQSRKLVWTKEFERFNRTRELDVVTLHTPFHSLIRYFKKKQELDGVSGNDKRIIEMLAAAYYIEMGRDDNYSTSAPREYGNLRWRFGQGYREKLATVAGLILPHFRIESEEVEGYGVTYLKPRFDIDKDFCLSADMPDIVHCLPRYSRALREKHSKGTHTQMSYLMPKMTKPGLIRDHWLVYGGDFLQGDFEPTQLAMMETVAEEQNISARLASSTLAEMVAKFQLVEDEVAQRGRWVYPFVVSADDIELHRDVLARRLDEQAVLMQKKVREAALPVLPVNGYLARELVTRMEFAVELPSYAYHWSAFAYETPIKNGRSIVLANPENPSMDYLVQLSRSPYHWAWKAWSVVGKDRRDCGENEVNNANKYVNYVNLAAVLGKYPTAMLIRVAPQVTSNLGAWAGSILRKIPRALVEDPREQLARKLGIAHTIRLANGEWPSARKLEFWTEFVRRKLMSVFQPKRYAKFAPQYEEDANDIPF